MGLKLPIMHGIWDVHRFWVKLVNGSGIPVNFAKIVSAGSFSEELYFNLNGDLPFSLLFPNSITLRLPRLENLFCHMYFPPLINHEWVFYLR